LSLPCLGALFVFTSAGAKTFENPVNGTAIISRAAVAMSGLAVLAVLAMLRNVIDKPSKPMSDTQRAVAHQM
jgi:hypothetical protein